MKYALAIAAFLLVLFAGCTQYQASGGNQTTTLGGNQTPAGTNEVKISGFAFSPATLTVKGGTTVTWSNQDSVTHTVTSAGNFDSGPLASGQSYSFTFAKAGEYDYGCSIHPSMKGKIIVQ